MRSLIPAKLRFSIRCGIQRKYAGLTTIRHRLSSLAAARRSAQKEYGRWEAYFPWLEKINRLAHRHPAAVLAYPAAADDIQTPLAIEVDRAVLIDPAYFKPGNLSCEALKNVILCFDGRARMVDALTMEATFIRNQRVQRLYFIGCALQEAVPILNEIAQGRPMIYMAKGTAQRSVYFPRNDLRRLNIVAIALDLLPGSESRRAERLYSQHQVAHVRIPLMPLHHIGVVIQNDLRRNARAATVPRPRTLRKQGGRRLSYRVGGT